MSGIEDLLRRRRDLLQEIDGEILARHTGEAAYLFTDIVGSTRYYEQFGDIAGRQMVLTHNDLLFPIIREHGGRVLKTIGDSIMALFDSPSGALRCTVAMQRAIRTRAPAIPGHPCVSVRMGLHFGRAMLEPDDVYGDAVNTAARVESAAAGDEIVVTGPLKERLAGCEVPLVFLGAEPIRGRQAPMDLYMVDWQGLGSERICAAWAARKAQSPDQSPVRPPAEPPAPPPPSRAQGNVTLGPRPDPAAEAAGLLALPQRGNPYLNRVMVAHPDLFVGRRALVRRILGRLGGERPQSLSIVGERRMGKSSLLNFLRSPGPRAEFLESPERCYFCLVDFQQARALSPGRLVSLVVEELRRQNATEIRGLQDLECLRAVGEAAGEAGCRIVLLLDEFEAVTRNPAIGPDFYAFLRSLANTLPLCFVCASGRNLKDLCVSREISDSPFFNIFSTVTLGPFDAADARALISGPSRARGLPLDAVGAQVLEMGGRLPFFLQIACSAWFEFLEAEGRGAEAFAEGPAPREVLDTFREESRPHFEFILESLPDREVQCLQAAGRGEPVDAQDPAADSLLRRGYLVLDPDPVPFSQEFTRFLLGRRGHSA